MGNNSDPITLHKYLYANVDPANTIDPSGYFGLVEAGVVNNIIGIQSSLTVDAGLNFLDSGLGMFGATEAQDAVRTAQTFLAVASLGAGGIALTKILAKKFYALSKAQKFDKFRKGLFGDIRAVRPRSLNRIEPPPGGVITLNHSSVDKLANGKVYIYVVDEADNLLLALRGSPGKSGVKHTQLTGGGPAKAAGELLVSDGKFLINNQSGRYSAQSASALPRVRGLIQSLEKSVTITGPI
jgi:hypothetical protein